MAELSCFVATKWVHQIYLQFNSAEKRSLDKMFAFNVLISVMTMVCVSLDMTLFLSWKKN
jgi:hypothetical protein